MQIQIYIKCQRKNVNSLLCISNFFFLSQRFVFVYLYIHHISSFQKKIKNNKNKMYKNNLKRKCEKKVLKKFIFICACINEDIKLSHNGGCFIIRFSSFYSPLFFFFKYTQNVHLLFFIIYILTSIFKFNGFHSDSIFISFFFSIFFFSLIQLYAFGGDDCSH